MAQHLRTIDAKLIALYDTFLFDCDGVIWRGDKVINGAIDVLNHLSEIGKKLIYVTNNSMKTREMYLSKLSNFGIKNVSVDSIVSSSYCTAVYMKLHNMVGNTYIIGDVGLREELSKIGATIITELNKSVIVDYVVIGLDFGFNYEKLKAAHYYLYNNKSCKFIATNNDGTYPNSDGVQPGAGSIVSALIGCIGRQPDVVVGKPSLPMMDVITNIHKPELRRTIMIGDRLDTDIMFGIKGGVDTLLVLTGVSKESDLQNTPTDSLPTYFVESLADIL